MQNFISRTSGTPAYTSIAAAVLLLWSGIGAQALAAPPTKKAAVATEQAAQSEVLRRLQELETQVGQYRAETQRLQAELAQRPAAPTTPTPTAAMPAAPKPTAAGGEWDEP